MNQSKNILILQRVLIALMLLYPICAFHVLPYVGDGERYYSRILLPLALITLGLKAWTHHLKLRDFLPFGAAVLPWILVVALLMAVHHRSGFSSYLILPLVAAILYGATSDIRYPKRSLYVISALFCILIAILQGIDVYYGTFSHWAEGNRGGLGGHPVPFAHTCSFFVGVVLIGLVEALEKKEEVVFLLLYSVAGCSGLILLYLTGTRGGQLAIAALLVMLFFKSFKNKNIIAQTLLIIVMVFCIYYAYQRFMVGINEVEAYVDNKGRDTSWGMRIQLWTIAWEGFLVKPIFGWGPDALPQILSSCPDISKWYHWHKTVDFHSDYWNILATGGAVLLCAYIAFMGGLAWIARKNFGALWAVINLLILGLSNTAIRGRAVAVSFFLVYLLFLLCSENKECSKKETN